MSEHKVFAAIIRDSPVADNYIGCVGGIYTVAKWVREKNQKGYGQPYEIVEAILTILDEPEWIIRIYLDGGRVEVWQHGWTTPSLGHPYKEFVVHAPNAIEALRKAMEQKENCNDRA